MGIVQAELFSMICIKSSVLYEAPHKYVPREDKGLNQGVI